MEPISARLRERARRAARSAWRKPRTCAAPSRAARSTLSSSARAAAAAVLLLANAYQRYRQLVERMQQGAVTATANGHILFANQRFSDMLGVPLAQLYTAPLESYVGVSDRARLSAFLMVSARDSRVEVELSRRDGTTIPVRMSLASFADGYASLLVTDLRPLQWPYDGGRRARLDPQLAREAEPATSPADAAARGSLRNISERDQRPGAHDRRDDRRRSAGRRTRSSGKRSPGRRRQPVARGRIRRPPAPSAWRGSPRRPSSSPQSFNKPSTWRAFSGSRLPVGSSASTSFGSPTSARAIATRCSSPPDSSRGGLASRPARPTAAMASLPFRVLVGIPLQQQRQRRRSARRVSCGRTWNAWNTKPKWSRRSSVSASSSRRGEILAFEQDLPGVDRLEPGDDIEQRRLADARVADDGDVLAGGDLERNAVEDDPLAEALGDPIEPEHPGRLRSRRARAA